MKNDTLTTLSAVINTLNQVSVSGKANLINLGNSIIALESVAAKLADDSAAPGSAE